MQAPPRAAVYTAECVGTFFLVLTVCCNIHTGSIGATLSIGAMLMVMVFALGSVSGAHLNPAVTLAVHLAGRDKIKPMDAVGYVAAQILGGVLGAFAYYAIDSEAAVLMEPTGHYTIREVLAVETFYTAALVYVVLNVATTTDKIQGNGSNGFFGLAIGFAVVASAISIGPISGCSLNPSVAFGNLFVARVVYGTQAYRNWIMYVFAPFGGSLLGSLLFFLVQGGLHQRFEYEQGAKAEAPPKQPTPPTSDDEDISDQAKKLTRQGSILVDKDEWIVLPDEVVNATFHCGVSWTMQQRSGNDEENIDMDLACVKFNKSGECTGAVYFAKKDDDANAIHHSGDAIMGDEAGDNEFVTFKLADVKSNVHMLAFVVTIYSSNLCFGDLKQYHVRLVSEVDKTEYCRHESTKMMDGCNALVAAVLYRKDGKWIFKPVDDCQKVPPHSSYRRLSFSNCLPPHMKHTQPDLVDDSVVRGQASPPSTTRSQRSSAGSARRPPVSSSR